MKGNIAIIKSPGTTALAPDYSAYLERGWLKSGTAVLLLGRGSKAGYRKIMVQGLIFEIKENSFSCSEIEQDIDEELLSLIGKEF